MVPGALACQVSSFQPSENDWHGIRALAFKLVFGNQRKGAGAKAKRP